VVAAAEPAPAPAEPAQGNVEPAQGSFDALTSLTTFARLAAQPEPPPAESPAPAPAAYLATARIFVGGEKGYVEPGEPYVPSDETERLLFLSQRVIRET
jgi:hypothetical protein